MTQMVKNLPAMQETRVQSVGQEDPLENGMATHSSIPAWRIPWTEESGTILKEISPEYSLEGLMLKLKLQYFGHLMQKTDLFEKTLMLGKIKGRGRRE